ncbi:MAG: hypothetical protein A2Z75_04850 [Chloroflexi bacterium RBG_13_50_10]|nr:MAG: hypothetical protein A2Z75_04850 [Chloroflexi bacterium RBG_13_50_10]
MKKLRMSGGIKLKVKSQKSKVQERQRAPSLCRCDLLRSHRARLKPRPYIYFGILRQAQNDNKSKTKDQKPKMIAEILSDYGDYFQFLRCL